MKRKVVDGDIIPRAQLLFLIKNYDGYKNIRDRALVAFLYLTGARISEVVRQIKKYQLEIKDLDGTQYLVIANVNCLKRKEGNEAKRNIPINIDKEMSFLKYIFEWVDELAEEECIFPISRQTAHNILIRMDENMWPHLMRHLRLTHLTTDYGFSAGELKNLTGWSNTSPADSYIHLNWMDIARKMK